MELTYNKCWDGKKHTWETQHANFPFWHGWCSKCGSLGIFQRRFGLVGKWEWAKNNKGERIFTRPEYFDHTTES